MVVLHMKKVLNSNLHMNNLKEIREELKDVPSLDIDGPLYKSMRFFLENRSTKELQKVMDANIRFLSLMAKMRIEFLREYNN